MGFPGPCDHDCQILSAHTALMKNSEYQFDFPAYQPPKVPDWLLALGRFLAHPWSGLKWSIWIICALLLLWGAYSLVCKFMPLRKTSKDRLPEREDWRPAPSAARELLHDSDTLAANGKYAEAVHLLLLRSVQEIDARRPNLLRPKHTSREIGRLQALPESARRTFGEIASVVERAVFAGDSLGASDFKFCRATYEAFALPDEWQERR